MATEKNDKRYYCQKCKKTMNDDAFYTSNNREKYPNEGKFPICKKCMTMHVDNFDSKTYLWILKEADVPYDPEEWQKLLQSYGKDKSKLTGMTIIGRYLSKMRLSQYKDYRWKDNAFIQELHKQKRTEAMRQGGMDDSEIAKANEIAMQEELPSDDQESQIQNIIQETDIPAVDQSSAGFDNTSAIQDVIDDLDLTDEDRTYLRLKWGKTYSPSEWVQLEQLYNEMTQSYDIQTAGHIDTLKLICKTSLKANQLVDAGDVEGFQKMSRVYDTLMKSGKFTAAQNKAEQGEYVDSIGELVAICETEGFIPRFYVGSPNDKVDQTIEDMKRYTKTLITEETNLGNLIEEAIKKNEQEDMADKLADDTDLGVDDTISELEASLHDNDFSDYADFIDNETLSDEELVKFLDEARKNGS